MAIATATALSQIVRRGIAPAVGPEGATFGAGVAACGKFGAAVTAPSVLPDGIGVGEPNAGDGAAKVVDVAGGFVGPWAR